jgi:hypothetical protein
VFTRAHAEAYHVVSINVSAPLNTSQPETTQPTTADISPLQGTQQHGYKRTQYHASRARPDVRSCSENIHAVTDRSISTTRNQTASPLVRLPADLRDIIFRFALYPVTVYVAFEPITPIRQGLTLPQVCRQIQRETKFVVNTYETVHLNVGPDCMWSANDFVRLASDLRAIFSTIVTLQLSPAATEWMNY